MNGHLTRGVDDYDQFETLPVYEPASRRRRARLGRDRTEVDRLRAAKCVDVARRQARRGRNHRRRVCLVAQSQLLVRRKRGRP